MQKSYTNANCVTIRDLTLENLKGLTNSLLSSDNVRVYLSTDTTTWSIGINASCGDYNIN